MDAGYESMIGAIAVQDNGLSSRIFTAGKPARAALCAASRNGRPLHASLSERKFLLYDLGPVLVANFQVRTASARKAGPRHFEQGYDSPKLTSPPDGSGSLWLLLAHAR